MSKNTLIKPYLSLKKFKILIATPTADRKNYCWDEFSDGVKSLSYPNFDFLIVDNSDTKDNYKKLLKEGYWVDYINPKDKSNIQYVCESSNRIRHHFLQKNYDYLLFLESDIIPPNDVIQRLIVHQQLVTSALYMIDFGGDSRPMIQVRESHGIINQHTINVSHDAGLGFVDGTLKQVFHAGLGCILIHKSVMQKIEFRYNPNVFIHPDTFFAEDCAINDIPIFTDTSIICKHHNSDWIHM